MSVSLPQPDKDYSKTWAQQLLNRLTKTFGDCFMKGQDLRLENGEQLIKKDDADGRRWRIYIESGVMKIEEVS